ncbi:MAG: circadian clock KaiB family protein [Spirochaetales bacterium]|nr:circadian clock KaiB family protein [Spirochaetales bacterium]
MAPPEDPTGDPWLFELFIAGDTPRSRAALRNLQAVCAACLKDGRYAIQVTDLREHPGAWRGHQILATPTAIRRAPLPERRVIGDLSRTEQVVAGLELPRLRPGEPRRPVSEPAGEGEGAGR